MRQDPLSWIPYCPQINVVFLFFAVRSLLKSKKRHWSTQQMKKKAKIITLVKWGVVIVIHRPVLYLFIHTGNGICWFKATKNVVHGVIRGELNFEFTENVLILYMWVQTNLHVLHFQNITHVYRLPYLFWVLSCQQGHFEGYHNPPSLTGTDLVVWNPGHWSQHLCNGMAVHHLQFHPGLGCFKFSY